MSQREKFEACLADHLHRLGGVPLDICQRTARDHADAMNPILWVMWQASRAAAMEEAVKVAESARDKMHSYHMPMQAAGAEVVCQEIRALAKAEGA